MRFDRTDRLILEALQKNARVSYKELSGLTGVASSTCLERVRSLRARGVIVRFRTEVDLQRLGRKLEALITIRFRAHSRPLVDPFVEYVLALPETLGLFNIAGPDDYLLHVAVADAAHLRTFVLDRLGSRNEIARLQTSLVYEHRTNPVVQPISENGT
jgi:DNA-binding Lrp family transcriptional regulator